MPVTRPSLLWPLLLIGLGALLLLQTLGLLPASLWAALAQLWPLLFIVFGLDLLIGRRSARGAAVVLGVGVVLVVAALTWADVRASLLPAGGQTTLIQTPQGASQVNVSIDFQRGQLNLRALGASDHLLEGSAQAGAGETVQQDYAVSDGAGRLQLIQHIDPLLAPFLSRRTDAAGQWDVHLAQHMPLALEVDGGDGVLSLDLSKLQVTSFDLHTGLGAATLMLPAGRPVRLRVSDGRSRVSLPAALTANGDNYTTAGFDPAKPFLDVTLDAGTGGVTIK
jgi:hypothetical protein